MKLSEYHQKFAGQPDAEIDKKVAAKRDELVAVFKAAPTVFENHSIRVAVLGCGDKRFVKKHKELFEAVLHKPIMLTTFDITTDHLVGEDGVVQHDCTVPLPGGPYDIAYAHVLLKFIDQSKQLEVLRNSYAALSEHGLAIHVLDAEDYRGEHPVVQLDQYKQQLTDESISFTEVPVQYGIALVLTK